MAGLDQLDQAPLQAAGVDPPEPAAALYEALLPGGEQARLVGAAAGAERPLPAQRVAFRRRWVGYIAKVREVEGFNASLLCGRGGVSALKKAEKCFNGAILGSAGFIHS